MRRIVGVHGVHQYRPGDPLGIAAVLSARWGAEIRLRVRSEVSVAYYADLLRKPGVYAEPLNTDRLDADAWSFARAFLAARLPDLRDEAGRMRVTPKTAAAILAGRRGLPGKSTHGFVAAYARETTRFLRTEGGFRPREAVVDRVARRFGGADVVIAHGLGAIVAYETLWTHSGIEIPLLVTVGSPVTSADFAGAALTAPGWKRPPNVERWVDLTGPRDLLGGGERPGEVELRQCGAHFDFHRPETYLRDGRVARAVEGG
ncbi:hypothetical protein Afil01_09450 [Actinorhabdospora filicis]|uniref:Uncharacterized protein n=1 Tax=Actinorhabdospora filicis TaxID=1785913 RepID=A0A9W6SHL6_9ACTN|nr:hypothetical protein [Actinorhabdospora filicis]GLZ76138.1 hypothetical protein Afil01_09450 [Actinorhabdospora filicis]